jgi:hypothetical protein
MMAKDEFHNALRILISLDAHELGYPPWWDNFCEDPFVFLIRAQDETVDRIWEAMVKRGAVKDIYGWDAEALDDIRRMLPGDLYSSGYLTRNPISQVYFRAGLLACREYMARFVEQGGNQSIADSIRANWWPVLGPDPGPPRLFDFDEVCDEVEGSDGKPKWLSKEIPPSIEALPRAHGFLLPSFHAGDPAEPKQD